MKSFFVAILLTIIVFSAQISYAISIGGSVRGGGFGIGASSDGSATVSGGRGPVSGSVRIDSDSDGESSTSNNQEFSNSAPSANSEVTVIFEIDPKDLKKYKGKTPKAYARQNGALIYSDIFYLAYHKGNKRIETKIVEADGYIRHSSMMDKDIVIKMPKGNCQMKNDDFICPK